MKVHYRIIDNDIEIVRCFGTDPEIVVPEKIDGRPVKRMAPYAFSARYTRQADAVPARAGIRRENGAKWRTSDGGMPGDE